MPKIQKLKNNIKKSHLLLFGSLLIFSGFLTISWRHLVKLRNDVFSDMKIAMMDVETNEEIIHNVPVVEDVAKPQTEQKEEQYYIDYDKYYGVLEIPRIGLKRGFYNTDSRYNNVDYNVTMVKGSTMPDVASGNLILMAHSGDAYNSYFAYLYRLNVGDDAFVTYNKVKYHYRIVNIYTVPKKGVVSVIRNYSKTTLTMVTCTKDDNSTQTVYIAELV